MRHLLTGLMCAGTLLLAACGGGDPAEDAAATDVGTAEQAILPQCRVGQNTRIFFYSDAAKTNQVGQRVCSCSGTVTTTGTVTSIWSLSAVPCNP
ncbi:DUF6289 family protein [Corallococcus exiguus]|uniref:Lipoprotein n=1 Tax=Corallococcus exiguus TaxID=83462 RepID=A0A7X4Y8J9_9BACT|nr:DUF6289 family protein [Corallococcus exiguus]NBC40910.1 hypothetical protein [Corallococcus exiguus]TNV53301.1 hypothetical protein FH620_36015 [Corallococcus exiguus]